MTHATTYRTLLATAMTEDDLLTNVLDLARTLGLRTAHFRPAWTERGWRTPVAGDGKGWPDLIIVGARLMVRELKAHRGKVDADQQVWLGVLTAAGVDAGVWRPAQWLDGTIQAQLRELRKPGVAA